MSFLWLPWARRRPAGSLGMLGLRTSMQRGSIYSPGLRQTDGQHVPHSTRVRGPNRVGLRGARAVSGGATGDSLAPRKPEGTVGTEKA